MVPKGSRLVQPFPLCCLFWKVEAAVRWPEGPHLTVEAFLFVSLNFCVCFVFLVCFEGVRSCACYTWLFPCSMPPIVAVFPSRAPSWETQNEGCLSFFGFLVLLMLFVCFVVVGVLVVDSDFDVAVVVAQWFVLGSCGLLVLFCLLLLVCFRQFLISGYSFVGCVLCVVVCCLVVVDVSIAC